MTHPTPLPAVDADVKAISEAIAVGNRDDMTPAMLAGYFADANPARLERLLTALAAAQAPAEVGRDAWISVDERLPEKNTEVLVAFDGISIPSTGQYTGSARDKHGWCYPAENYNSCDDGTDPVVIAWRPLPPPPIATHSAKQGVK